MPVRRHPVANSVASEPLAGVPIDRALASRLRDSYARIRKTDLRFAEIFYAKLFAKAPDLAPLFRSEPRAQCEKLMASLDAIVRNLEAPLENAAMLAALGKRHVNYGAKPEHYTVVVNLLIESMQDLLGVDADDQSLEEWRLALRLVSDLMIAAGNRPAKGGLQHPHPRDHQ